MKFIMILSAILGVSVCAIFTNMQDRSIFLENCRTSCVNDINIAIAALAEPAKTTDKQDMKIWEKCTYNEDGGDATRNIEYEYNSCSNMEFSEGLFYETAQRYQQCYNSCNVFPNNAQVKRTASTAGAVERDYTLFQCISNYCPSEASFGINDRAVNPYLNELMENQKCQNLCTLENDTKLSFAEKDERDYFIGRIGQCMTNSPNDNYDFADGDETLHGKQEDLVQSLSCQIFRSYSANTQNAIQIQYSKQYFVIRESCYNYCKEREQVNKGNRKNENVNTVLKCQDTCNKTFYQSAPVNFDNKGVKTKFIENSTQIMTISLAFFGLLAIII